MDQAQGAAGTGEAEQPTQTQQEPKVEKPRSLSDELSNELRAELGAEAGGPKSEEPKSEEPKAEVGSQKSEEEPEPEEAGDTPATTPEPEQEQEKEPEEEEETDVPGDWPKTAKARVAEEARKRRERTAERDQWKAEAERLNAQLQQANTVQLRPTKALSEVVDRQSLSAAENHWKEIRRFARTNPDGADDVLIGKDAQGNEIRRDYSREEVIKMGLDADEAIEALPARREFVAKAEAEIAAAKAVYPDLWKETEAGREAAGIVQRAPWILQEPDWAFVIGDYLAGRKARLGKAGKSGPAAAGLSPGAQAILGAPKVAPAPGVIKSRSASGGPGGEIRQRPGGNGSERVDQKQARDELLAKGLSDEAMEDFIAKSRLAQGANRGGVKPALA